LLLTVLRGPHSLRACDIEPNLIRAHCVDRIDLVEVLSELVSNFRSDLRLQNRFGDVFSEGKDRENRFDRILVIRIGPGEFGNSHFMLCNGPGRIIAPLQVALPIVRAFLLTFLVRVYSGAVVGGLKGLLEAS
jgi:hypothetical protein